MCGERISSFAPPPCTSPISSPQCFLELLGFTGLWVGGTLGIGGHYALLSSRAPWFSCSHTDSRNLCSVLPQPPEHFSSFHSCSCTVLSSSSLLFHVFGCVVFLLRRWSFPVVHRFQRSIEPWCSQSKWAFSHATNFFIYELAHVWNGVNSTIIIIHPVIVSAQWDSTSYGKCLSWWLERGTWTW